jgi:hypothetical protein
MHLWVKRVTQLKETIQTEMFVLLSTCSIVIYEYFSIRVTGVSSKAEKDSELDLIINYNIKYRMGDALGGEEEDID